MGRLRVAWSIFALSFIFFAGLIGMVGIGRATVPDLKGKSIEEARRLAANGSFAVVPTYQKDFTSKNTVIAQSPSPGKSIPRGATIRVLVSLGMPPVNTQMESATVPNAVGLRSGEAKAQLVDAGFGVASTLQVSSTPTDTVISQFPTPGTTLLRGAQVSLVVSNGATPVTIAASGTATGKWGGSFVVVVDPGHQKNPDSGKEPLGPSSSETRARMEAGTSGVQSHVTESDVDLKIALELAKRLRAAGVKVVMTRTTDDVKTSNKERALKANTANASLFLSIHANSSTDHSVNGIEVLHPDKNSLWSGTIYQKSLRAAQVIDSALWRSTKLRDRGLSGTTQSVSLNWLKVPGVIAKVGFLSNQDEDRLLSSDVFRQRAAQGLYDGVKAFLTGT